jgi:hypothetical protein
MYMLRNPTLPDTVTLVIEDPARSAVNISTVASGPFDYFLQTSLLQVANKSDPQQGANPSAQQERGAQQNQASQAGRWIPRPTYVQIEGITVHDPSTDFKISVGMLNARGGASGASSSTSSNLIVQVSLRTFHAGMHLTLGLQVEYLPSPTLPAASSHILQQYVSQLLPEHGSLSDLSMNTSQLDWRGILGVGPEEQNLPEWSMRNTSWCMIKMCKEANLI